MKTFKDSTGREWNIAINIGVAMTIKDVLDIDLLQPEAGDPPLLTRLGTDELLLGEVLCVLMANQFNANNVTAEDVHASFDGKTLLAAQTAFYDELSDFFRQRGRPDRAKAIETQQEMIQKAVKVFETKIENLDVDATIAGAIAGLSPEPLESTRDH